MKKVFGLIVAILLVFGFLVQAQAAPIIIGSASYDSNNDGTSESYNLIWTNASPFGSIVWLDYTKSSNTWANQVAWASGLNTAGILTYTIDPIYIVTWSGDWRLPSTVDGPYVYGYDGTTTGGYNITSSEMGHLFYDGLGNKGYYDTSGNYVGDGNWGLTKTGEFQHLLNSVYWSGTEYAASPGGAWDFYFYVGGQYVYLGGHNCYALAVRPGDVAAVPEPATMLLLGSGLIGLVAYRKRLRRRHG